MIPPIVHALKYNEVAGDAVHADLDWETSFSSCHMSPVPFGKKKIRENSLYSQILAEFHSSHIFESLLRILGFGNDKLH